MAELGCQGAGHELVVHGLVHSLVKLLLGAEVVADEAAGHEGVADDAVDLIEGQPILDLVFIAGDDGLDIAQEELHRFTVGPAVVLGHERQRRLVV